MLRKETLKEKLKQTSDGKSFFLHKVAVVDVYIETVKYAKTRLILLFVKGYKSTSPLMFLTLSQCVPLQEELHELKKRKLVQNFVRLTDFILVG